MGSLLLSINSVASFIQQSLTLLEGWEKLSFAVQPEARTWQTFGGIVVAPDSMGTSFAGLQGHVFGAHRGRMLADFEVDTGGGGKLTVRRVLPASMLPYIDDASAECAALPCGLPGEGTEVVEVLGSSASVEPTVLGCGEDRNIDGSCFQPVALRCGVPFEGTEVVEVVKSRDDDQIFEVHTDIEDVRPHGHCNDDFLNCIAPSLTVPSPNSRALGACVYDRRMSL